MEGILKLYARYREGISRVGDEWCQGIGKLYARYMQGICRLYVVYM